TETRSSRPFLVGPEHATVRLLNQNLCRPQNKLFQQVMHVCVIHRQVRLFGGQQLRLLFPVRLALSNDHFSALRISSVNSFSTSRAHSSKSSLPRPVHPAKASANRNPAANPAANTTHLTSPRPPSSRESSSPPQGLPSPESEPAQSGHRNDQPRAAGQSPRSNANTGRS